MKSPGIYPGIPEREYREAGGICQTDSKEVLISPAHYYARITGPRPEPTEAQKIGTLTHAAGLEKTCIWAVKPDDFDGRSKAGKEWLASQNLTVVSKDIHNDILGMRNSVRSHPVASGILKAQGNNEVAAWTVDEETGLLLKGMADRVTTDNNGFTVVADLKTVKRGEADMESFSKSIFNWGYAYQAYFYSKLLFGATFFVFIGSAPFVYIEYYGLTPTQFSLCFALNAASFFALSQLTARLSARFGLAPLIRWSVAGVATVMALLALTTLWGNGLPLMMALLFIGFGFLGLLLPAAGVLSLEDHGAVAGSASALLGAIQMITAAVAMSLAGLFADHTPAPMLIGIALSAVAAMLTVWWTLRRLPAHLQPQSRT